MASQPSVFNEERNRLRLQAWEQRNQESSQTKELKVENVPLFGEPYKTNKGDELSSRIQRMLGSYEDVNHPNPADPSPTPYATISQPDQCQPDKPTKAPFHTQVSTQTQKGSSSNGYSSQPTRTSSSSPNQQGHSSTFSKASLTHSQGALVGQSAHEQKKSEAFSDFRDRISLPQEMSAQSPDTKSQDFLHSGDLDTKDTINMRPLQGSIEHLSAPSSTMDVARMINKQSPKDASLPHANKTNALPSQTFPPLLSSKQPSAVMTQKPTAYVRPMDGQDQVVSESPDLKPSPEPYAPLPESINKPDLGKIKTLPQFLETKTNEAQCVEDILKEMTHSWPPLLTAIHTPRTDEASKSPLSAKEAEHVSSCQVQKSSSPRDTPQLSQQNSLPSLNAVLSSGAESASSSDSESSSRSESDSESAAEEPNEPTVRSAVETEPDAPAASHGDWQLWNWIRSNPQSSSTEGQGAALVSESPTHKQPVSIQSSKHSSVDVVNPIRESKLSPPQKEFSDNFAKPQQCSESSQDNYHQSCQQSPSADLFKRLCSVNSLKPVKAECPDRTEAALCVKGDEDSATRVQDPCSTDRPKVKTKTRHSKKSKDSGDTKRDGKRTLKHLSLDKRKTGPEPEPEVTLVLYGRCPTCGVRYPNPCCCSSRSPAQPDQLSPAPPVSIGCSKVKSETTCQKGSKMPHKTSHKHSEKTGHAAKASKHHSGPPKSLLVKIDLGLLSRVPRASRSRQEILNNTKRSAVVIEQDGAGSDASTIQKRTKASKKTNPKNAELDNDSHPRKKQKLENKNTSSTHGSAKLDSVLSHEDREHKKAKQNHVQLQQPVTPKDTATGSKLHKHKSGDTQEPKEAAKSKEPSKHKKRSVKLSEHPHVEKKAPKSSLADPPASQPNRALLRFEDRQYPVKHYIKEAKRLKHKADAETDKLSKAFNYLDAAMYFVESGIAMEKDPQISVSSYTMFAETVELLKFVLKLKDPVDPSATPSEKDFLALCLKCQSLLHMAMFRLKHKTALEYSKILTNHFNSSAQTPHNPSLVTLKTTSSPLPSVSSPAGPGFIHGVAANSGLAVGSTTALPRAIEQVAFTYVNITMLFLSAHDTWEQAKELAHRGSGMLTELDTAIGPLSFTSTMSFMVRYTRQGVHWLRLDSQKVK